MAVRSDIAKASYAPVRLSQLATLPQTIPDPYSHPAQRLLSHLDDFTEEELHHLNRLIVEHPRLMHQVKAHRSMTQFRIGQTVTFTTSTGQVGTGILTKCNRKSVGVTSNDPMQWTVAPTLLKPA